MISGDKHSSHPLELYSKRVEAVRWFEQHHPDQFDLYGMGWNQTRFNDEGVRRFLAKMPLLRKHIGPHFPSYKGMVKEKLQTLGQYKYAICYENAKNIDGYITEKIFDCFFAGCIPVYWGAGNVADHIPSECFIDRRNFSSYEQLYDRLAAITAAEYEKYLDHIAGYLQSSQSCSFSAEYFIDTILGALE